MAQSRCCLSFSFRYDIQEKETMRYLRAIISKVGVHIFADVAYNFHILHIFAYFVHINAYECIGEILMGSLHILHICGYFVHIYAYLNLHIMAYLSLCIF